MEFAMLMEGGRLGCIDDVIDPAYVASIVASLPLLDKKFPGLRDHILEVAAVGGVPRCQAVSEFIAAVRRLQVVDPELTFETLLGPTTATQLRGLQATLTAPLRKARLDRFEAWLADHPLWQTLYDSSKPPEARAWLSALPKTAHLTIVPAAFRTALRNLLHLPHPAIPPLTKCICGTVLDRWGIHLLKCQQCGHDTTVRTHDIMVQEVSAMLTCAGIRNKPEVPDLLIRTSCRGGGDQRRLDIATFPLDGLAQLFDVTITHAVTAEVERGGPAPVAGSRARAAEQAKNRKYKSDVAETGSEFVGLVLESGGRYGAGFQALFKKCIALMSLHRHQPKGVLATYWRRRLSVALQARGIATALNTRLYRMVTSSLQSETHADECQYTGVLAAQSQSWVHGVNIDAADGGGGIADFLADG
jgi:hypothetical protein